MNDLIGNRVVLYTIPNCPKCTVIKKKLCAKFIQFEEISDDESLSKLKSDFFPQLQIDDGEVMEFSEINNWLNSLEA
jgi:glutaredoxin